MREMGEDEDITCNWLSTHSPVYTIKYKPCIRPKSVCLNIVATIILPTVFLHDLCGPIYKVEDEVVISFGAAYYISRAKESYKFLSRFLCWLVHLWGVGHKTPVISPPDGSPPPQDKSPLTMENSIGRTSYLCYFPWGILSYHGRFGRGFCPGGFRPGGLCPFPHLWASVVLLSANEDPVFTSIDIKCLHGCLQQSDFRGCIHGGSK